MKKLLIFSFILVLTLSGCSDPPLESAVGDFTLIPPEGYSIEDITDINCAIVRDEDSTVVGGMELTALKQKALTEDHAKSIILYLQEEFHKTNNVEYIASHWRDANPIVTVHLRKHEDPDSQTMFSHIFFQKDSWVYHLWLNENMAGEDAADAFIKIISF